MSVRTLRRLAVHAAAALPIALTAAPSAAEPTAASASLTNITFTLEDLDLTDGIAPAYSFLEGVSSRVFASVRSQGMVDDQTQELITRGFLAPLTASQSIAVARADAAITASGLRSSGSLLPGAASFAASATIQADDVPSFFGILLTPHTRLIITGDAVVAASVSDDAQADDALGRAGFFGLNGFEPSTLDSEISAFATTFAGGPRSDALSGQVGAAFANRTGEEGLVAGQMFASAQGSMVPEPQSWALMLLGLAALGGARRLGARSPDAG